MTQNRWQLGTMYFGGKLNGQPFYTQSAPFEPVYPGPYNGVWTDFPIIGLTINESAYAWWPIGCMHAIAAYDIVHEWDYETNMDCALICCPSCRYVQNVIEPFSAWLDPIQHAIIVG